MNETTTPSIAGNAKHLLTSPSRFFSLMPKSGGFGEPILFIIAMAVTAAVLCALGSIPGQGIVAAFKLLVGKSVLWSIYALLGVFVASVVFFFIWKLLGSLCSYETAFRCTAYTTVMLPVTLLLSLIPLIGVPVGLLWAGWLLVTASTAAHGLPQQKPLLVFGLLALLAIWCVASCGDADESTAGIASKAPIGANNIAAKSAAEDAPAVTELEPVKVVVTAESAKAVAAGDHEESIARSAEDAGKALGELVKGMTDMAKNVGEDIAQGIDNTLDKALPNAQEEPSDKTAANAAGAAATVDGAAAQDESTSSLQAASETVGETVGALVKSLGDVARDASEGLQKALQGEQSGLQADSNVQQQPADAAVASAPAAGSAATDGSAQSPAQANADALSPEQLGAALGEFINQLNVAANSAAKGFEQGRQRNGDAELSYEGGAATDAGEALGRFIRSFNEAVRELEAQAPENER
ncbi:MAG: YIP1 family protein [Gammaproteobacteria bacterium]|nr:YIP1 family protein [Gammaproteobacteria bacterium]